MPALLVKAGSAATANDMSIEVRTYFIVLWSILIGASLATLFWIWFINKDRTK